MMSSGSGAAVPSATPRAGLAAGACRRALLGDRRERRRLAEPRVEVVLKLAVVARVDQAAELRAGHARGHVVRARRAEHVRRVPVDLVRPAHVLREQAARDHVVADHGLRRHVTDQGVREARAPALERLHVLHAVAVDRVRPRLVEHDDHHVRGPIGRLRGRREHRHRRQRNDQRHEQRPATRHDQIPLGNKCAERLSYRIPWCQVNGLFVQASDACDCALRSRG